jgi:uroporphyrinogen-III synthase
VLVLVTRPRAQAGRTVALLRAAGHDSLVDPVLEVRRLPPPALAAGEAAAVAVTSANAAPAVPALPADLPVFAVGEATAEAVRALGRPVAGVAGGDGRDLAALIGRSVPAGNAVLHLGGRDVRDTLRSGLVAAGYAYRSAAVYEAVAATALALEADAAVRDGRLGAALFYSPRSAALWAGLARSAGLADRLGPVLAACLSEAVAGGLAGLRFRAVRVAASRDQTALLRCLDGQG